MIQFFITLKSVSKQSVLLLSIGLMLSGCLGGTVAQQIARSIATSVADNAVGNAMDVEVEDEQDRFSQNKKTYYTEQSVAQPITTQQSLALQSLPKLNPAGPNTTQQNPLLQKNTALQEVSAFQQNIASQQIAALQKQSNEPALNAYPVDPYKLAFVNAQFETIKPIAEPLPEQLTEVEAPIAVVQSNQLVPVELFNLLIGEEKAAVYTKAQLLGSSSLPKQREWKLWRVATGMIKTNVINSENTSKAVLNSQTNSAQSKQIITFLIPPEFGKLPSGSIALVEIASPGELNIARYKIN